jgi:acetyl esterase/lipase
MKLLAALVFATTLLAADDPLRFAPDRFEEETRTVRTTAGEKHVLVRAYKHIPYVANPVDKDYQSLDILVPVTVDGKAVAAAQGPILFRISVGGYMSSRNAGGGAGGRGGRGPGRGGAAPTSGNVDLALAAGYVVVQPGCRGRDNKTPEGVNYGKAPAAIVDLKAAVRYLRHNRGAVPGNVDWIVATGVSAGGALTALLGASGNTSLYKPYLEEIGAASEGEDHIFAAAPFCPITDLEHADMAYEWMFAGMPDRLGQVPDRELSKQLEDQFTAYQASLKLQGLSGFGALTAANYDRYVLQQYLFPSAARYVKALAEDKRKDYLAANPWISWNGAAATFSWPDYLKHIGRMKGLPAFDDFDGKAPEPNLFGNKSIDSRHFTLFSLHHADPSAELDRDIPALRNLMNAMCFLGDRNPGVAPYWWIRHGSSDRDTSLPIIVNLATALENRGKNVNALLYWDAGHGADQDAEDFIRWIGKITSGK